MRNSSHFFLFAFSMRPPGGFNMSGGGMTSRPGMGGTSGMFGGGGGGGGTSNSMAMMGRPQSAQMMAPSFSSRYVQKQLPQVIICSY